MENKFDIRALERAILNSRTYQLSVVPNETNRFDRINYAHSYIRPMLAEVVVDVINDAAGTTESFGNEAPRGVGPSRLAPAGCKIRPWPTPFASSVGRREP